MTYYSISALINAVVSILLGFFVLYKNPKDKINKSLFFWCFTVFFWSIFYFIWQIETDKDRALIWTKLLMLGAIWVPVAYLKFILIFLDIKKKYNTLLSLNYALAIIFSFLLLTPLMVTKVEPVAGFTFWPRPGLAYIPFLIMFLGVSAYAAYLSYRALKIESSLLKKSQIRYILLGWTISIIAGSTNYFLWYDIPIKPYGNILASTYVVLTVYAILRYRLFGIRVILNKTLVYTGAIISTSIIFYILYLLYKDFFGLYYFNPYLSALLCALIFSLIFTPLYSLSKKLSAQIFYSGYNPYDNVDKIICRLKDSRDIKDLLNNLSAELKKALGITKINFIIILDDRGYSFEPIFKQRYEKNIINKLISFFQVCKIILIKDEIMQLAKRRESIFVFKTEQMEIFKNTDSYIIAPFYNNDLLIGILLIGKREKSRPYNTEDIVFLEKIIKGITNAIINFKTDYILDIYRKRGVVS